MFSFFNVNNLTLAGQTKTDYTVVVKGVIGSLKPLQATASFVLTLKNPCVDPQTISVPILTNPPSYTYDGSTLVYKLIAPYMVVPAVCKIVYSCKIADLSPRTDLCSIVEGATAGVFNSITGSYSFKSIDNINFPPGLYTF